MLAHVGRMPIVKQSVFMFFLKATQIIILFKLYLKTVSYHGNRVDTQAVRQGVPRWGQLSESCGSEQLHIPRTPATCLYGPATLWKQTFPTFLIFIMNKEIYNFITETHTELPGPSQSVQYEHFCKFVCNIMTHIIIWLYKIFLRCVKLLPHENAKDFGIFWYM